MIPECKLAFGAMDVCAAGEEDDGYDEELQSLGLQGVALQCARAAVGAASF